MHTWRIFPWTCWSMDSYWNQFHTRKRKVKVGNVKKFNQISKLDDIIVLPTCRLGFKFGCGDVNKRKRKEKTNKIVFVKAPPSIIIIQIGTHLSLFMKPWSMVDVLWLVRGLRGEIRDEEGEHGNAASHPHERRCWRGEPCP